MWKILVVAAAAACAATPALAQTQTAASSAPYAGTWGFQSEDYGNDDYGAAMSGVMVITAGSSAHHYNINLLAQEMISQKSDDESHLLVAREDCKGEDVSGQLTVTCELSEPVDNYQPDAFAIQAVDHDHLGGALTSSDGASVNFNRVR